MAIVGHKYLRIIKAVVGGGHPATVDVYCVLDAYAVTCPARAHAVKKLLCAGLRGKGSELDDLREALEAVQRAVELQGQREAAAKPQGD